MFQANDLTVVLDTTTYCNARCPQCDRNDSENQLKRNAFLPLMHVSLDDIKKAFTKRELAAIKTIQFSPGWGDALMHPDLIPMLDHLFTESPRSLTIQVITNGSIQTDNWWFDLGSMMYKHDRHELNMTFDVDGINQAMHEKYRRGTKLNRTIGHMHFASSFPNTLCNSQTIVFKHNQDHMDEIEELCLRAGSSHHTFIRSERFHGDTFEFENEVGEIETLELADPFEEKSDRTEEITCPYAVENKININFDGQAFPCCYFTNAYVAGDTWSAHADAGKWKRSWIGREYLKDKETHNIYNTSIVDMLDDVWWTEKLPTSWKTEPALQCEKHCSLKNGSFRVGRHTK